MECSWNDRSKTQYYIVILNLLQGRSGGLERALESRVRGPLTRRDWYQLKGLFKGFCVPLRPWESLKN